MGSDGWTTPVASCLMATSGDGEPRVSTIRGVAWVLVLKAAAVSMSKIALFNLRLPFFMGSGFVAGETVPHCWILLLRPDACDEASTRVGLPFAPIWSLLPRERKPVVMDWQCGAKTHVL